MNPIVVVEMADGKSFSVELYPEYAPNTVANFISLIQKGFYNGLIFHRIVKNCYIHGGDPAENGTGGPGYCIAGEFPENGFNNSAKHKRGALTMVRNALPNTAGSQFAILVEDLPYMDGHNAVFGAVVSGMDVVDHIANLETDERDRPRIPQKIQKMSVETFGIIYGEPEIEHYLYTRQYY